MVTKDDIIAANIFIDKKLKVLPDAERRLRIRKLVKDNFGHLVSQPMCDIIYGSHIDGDSGISLDQKPEWLDYNKFQRGQKFARDNLFSICAADLISLFNVFSIKNEIIPLVINRKSSTPYTAFKRYLSTNKRICNWYTSNPWTARTPAYEDIRTVRKIHAMVRKEMASMSSEEYLQRSQLKEPWCPSFDILQKDFSDRCTDLVTSQCQYAILLKHFKPLQATELSQTSMSLTQFAFVGLIVIKPKFFGIQANEEDLEAFCHVWRGIGFLLGIEDEFNFCRGTLEEIRVRVWHYFEYLVKPNFQSICPKVEHMMRCAVEGVGYYFPGYTFEISILDLAKTLDFPMPRLYSSLSYYSWIKHRAFRFLFKYGMKFESIRKLLNRQVMLAIKNADNYNDMKLKDLQKKSQNSLNPYLKKL